MDVNGTRFHLFKGASDWGRCCEDEECDGPVSPQREWTSLKLTPADEAVTLSPLLSLFKQRRRQIQQGISSRRGTARDRFGSWYWIGNDRHTIYWMPFKAARPIVFWSQDVRHRTSAPGAFEPNPEEPVKFELSGFAITEHHYLVVGIAGDRTHRGGFFIFDLDSGGEPSMMLFPEGISFNPFDMSAAPGGGVWILDKTGKAYWGLDRQFRVIAQETLVSPPVAADPPTFRGVDEPASCSTTHPFPTGFSLDAKYPISIEAMPDGSVLILDSPAISNPSSPAQPSVLHHYRLGVRLSSTLIQAQTEVVMEGEGEETTEDGERVQTLLSVVGYDIAFTPGDNTLYVVERDGNQALAFALNVQSSPPVLLISRDYLPMHFFGGRALVADSGQVFYDVVGGDLTRDPAVRWMPLQVIDQPRYEREGTLFTPKLDGKERDCVWHRLFIDGCIPAESNVEVWSRAHNDPSLLPGVPFTREPALYLRGASTEIPFYDAFPEREVLPENTGTWELAIQRANGRYIQLKLVLSGNGRVTPHLHALRVYYPRFSYPKRYLPNVYLEDQQSELFLERFLGNIEGFYTDIEGKMSDVSLLFDGRSAPRETLDWLASWLGLVMDPLWARIQEQRATNGPKDDRRRLFIRFARKLYDARGTTNGIKFALHLLLDACLERTLARFKMASIKADLSLRDELRAYDLAYPLPVMTDVQIEDLLYDYLLAPARPTKVRVVERYVTRGGRALVEGDTSQPVDTAGQSSSQSSGLSQDEIDASAHKFSVLVPQGLIAEEELMVTRVVEMEKPAHTQFAVGHYWDFFRVGETRLGLDTLLGEESRFVPVIIGRNYLGEGYLYPPNPMDLDIRVIADRDRVGYIPAL